MVHQRTLQSFMVHPNLGDVCVKRGMVMQFEDNVYEGTLRQEFLDAVVYCQHIVGDGDGAIGHHMPQGSGEGHPCAIPEEPTAKSDGIQPDWLKRTTSHLVPHLGGVAASIGTFNRAGVYTLARACASAL